MAEACDCQAAIVELHDFFAAWYRGDHGVDIGVMENALAVDFRLVTPKATVVARDRIIEATVAQRGAHPESRIEVRPVTCTRVRGLHLSTYEEWHHEETERPARLSTAVLSPTGAGWRWHLVHETWLDPGRSAE